LNTFLAIDPKPGYDAVMPTHLRAVIRTAAAAILVLLIGTVGYMALEGWGVLDALYMTSITVTTIGYEEVFPLSVHGRVFTIFMAFAGIGVILLVASEFARVVLETDLRRLIGLRRDLTMIKKLRDHIVVCGYGRMGRAVVEVLRDRNEPFVVVESREDLCRHLEEERVPFVAGDATEEATLTAAGVPAAKTFLACLADDANNVFAILLARQLNPDIVAIARAVEEGSEERLRLAGANKVTNPYRLGGMRLAYTAIKPTVMDFIEASLAGTSLELELAEMVVKPASELVGKTLAEAEVRRRFGIIVVALKRGQESTFNPGPDARMEAGDVLVALGPLQCLDNIEKALE
jgi:voltage-gated potassium channel